MSDYIKHKEYKLPKGRTVTADFDDLGIAKVTINAMDAMFDIINSADLVEVVRCKDCDYAEDLKRGRCYCSNFAINVSENGFCYCGERAET